MLVFNYFFAELTTRTHLPHEMWNLLFYFHSCKRDFKSPCSFYYHDCDLTKQIRCFFCQQLEHQEGITYSGSGDLPQTASTQVESPKAIEDSNGGSFKAIETHTSNVSTHNESVSVTRKAMEDSSEDISCSFTSGVPHIVQVVGNADSDLDTLRQDNQPCDTILSYQHSSQVWPLTQFFSVSFLGKLIDPSSGKYYSLPFLPATPSSLSGTLEGLFELTRRPSRVLASCVASGTTEIQGHRQVFRAAGVIFTPWSVTPRGVGECK